MEEDQDIEKALEQYRRRVDLRKKLDQIHASMDMDAIQNNLQWQQQKRPTLIRQLWQAHKPTLAIAASVALVTTFATLFTVWQYRSTHQQQAQYSMLRRDVQAIKQSQNQILSSLSARRRAAFNSTPARVAGTSFLVAPNGYLVTNNHIVQGADSVYVQDHKGDVYKARIVYTNRGYDLAILQIQSDSSYKPLPSLPYSFEPRTSDLGERVFTLGYPRDEIVYDEGYLSSRTGFRNDSSAYQVAISVNPGNSGGPLLDEKGNVIGVISGKQISTEGASFAIKTDYLFRAIGDIPGDSLKGASLKLNRKNTLAKLPRKQQIKKVQECVYLVKVFKH
ncbi:S1 family peptidase [Arsenicibacter rosenii]|uniref:Serine protease n=1 Tax=Arsenicibacter rosenii TaxID=1750698 RepID=A0A1S2VNI3_9BACT|nr:serine protease [Arsenicibacter rosenii]OIN60342.1 serine protease [Arsenicibacter rosenii]